jgi:succinate dehydrogenase / fumarate reductase flavoprotein subunit
VTGAFGYWRTTGQPIAFAAKATILATGGIGKAYEVTSNSWEYSGDGQALAYEAGAELIDMEFVQFHPTGMVWPPGVRGLLITEAVRGEGGILRNVHGDRFMWEYLPDERRAEYAETAEEAARWVTALSQGRETDARRPPELSTRDNVARAIYTEVREGRGTPHGGVYLDISYLPADHVRRKLPSMYEQFKELADVDITRGPMEVGPTTHYVMGGIRVDPDSGATTVPGLFAVGEVSAGLHGANRLGGNSLSDLLVFGARTGAAAATLAAAQEAESYLDPVQIREAAEDLAAPLERPEGEDPYAIQRDLQAMMQRLVGIFRIEADLDEALRELADLRRRWELVRATGGRAYNPGWNLVFEVGNLLTVSEAITRSARQRTESRGAHSRLDYPATDDATWGTLNSVVARAEDGTMAVASTPLPAMADELRGLLGADH